jgi:DNA-directed RNA polymerase subunit K/omega
MQESHKDKDTKYEKARVIGARALQISMGAPFLIKIDKEELEALKYNPVKIAEKEYDKGVLPLTINRPMPDTRKRSRHDDEEEEQEEAEEEEVEREEPQDSEEE